MKKSFVALFLYSIFCSLALWSSAVNSLLEAKEDLKLPDQISKGQQIHCRNEGTYVDCKNDWKLVIAGVNQMVEREGDGRNYPLSRKAQKGKGAYGGANMTHKHRQNEKSQAMRPSNFSFSISISCISFWVLIIFGFAYFSP